MVSRCWCEDPIDFTLLAFKLASTYFGGDIGFVFYMCRAAIGMALDIVEIVILKDSVLKNVMEDHITLDVVIITCITLLMIGAFLLVGSQAGSALQRGIGDVERQRRINIFFLTFKTIHVIIVFVLLAGTIYGIDHIDSEKAEQIFLLVALVIDVAFDPSVLVFGFCKYHTQLIQSKSLSSA